MTRLRGQRGAAIVEMPLASCLILLIGMGIVTLVQVMWTHIDLASAAGDATRYAARVEWDPSAETQSSDRRRTTDQVKAWAAEVAAEAGVSLTDVEVVAERCPCDVVVYGDDGEPAAEQPAPVVISLEEVTVGDKVVVTIRKTVSNPLYQLAASATNAAAGVFHLGQVFDPEGLPIKAEAETHVE